MSVQRKEKGKGFTIIEVVLVLAIGALIFLMALLAFPALQRSQRDTQRKNDLTKMTTATSNYQSNNRNALPTSIGASGSTITTTWYNLVYRYVRGNGVDEFNDPSGNAYELKDDSTGSATVTYSADHPTIYITTGKICSGEGLAPGSAGARRVAFRMALEGGGIACVNN